MNPDAHMAQRLNGLSEPLRSQSTAAWHDLQRAASRPSSALDGVIQRRAQNAAQAAASPAAPSVAVGTTKMRPQTAIVSAIAAGALVLGATAVIRRRRERSRESMEWTAKVEQERATRSASMSGPGLSA